MERIINLICHPKFIVFYFKDKVYKIILTLLSFFILVLGLVALYDFNTTYYNYEYVSSLADDIASTAGDKDISYTDSKFSGDSYQITGEDISIIFLKDNNYSTDYGLLVIFKEDHAEVYYQRLFKYELKYDGLDLGDFTFSELSANSASAKLKLTTLLDNAFRLANNEARIMIFMSDVMTYITIYLFTLVAVLFVSFVVNPAIEFKYRIRICLYDTVIFFVVMMFMLMFNIAWLRYLAMAMPAFYAMRSFRSIVRVG